jgi:hypothetical protein
MYYLPQKDASVVIVVSRCDADYGPVVELFAPAARAFFPEGVKGLLGKPKRE